MPRLLSDPTVPTWLRDMGRSPSPARRIRLVRTALETIYHFEGGAGVPLHLIQADLISAAIVKACSTKAVDLRAAG